MEKIEIEEIKKYVDELIASLRQTGQTSTVDALQAIVERFKQASEVRPAVYKLDGMVRQWLRNPSALPQDPATQLTAQFLADACKNALAQGAIHSLRPTRRESARKLGRLAVVTLCIGGALVIIPALLLVLGFNWIDILMPPEILGIRVERGSELQLPAHLQLPAPSYDGQVVARVELAGRCSGPAWEDLACEPSEHLWSDGVRHVSYHLVRHAEVNGLVVALRDERVAGSQGHATLLVHAGPDTAPGDYLIPLQGAYIAEPKPCAIAGNDAGTPRAATNTADASDTAGDAGAGIDDCTPPETEATVLKHSAVKPLLLQVQ